MQIIYRMQKISNFLLNQTQVPQTTFYKVSVFTLSYPAWALAMHSLQVKQDRLWTGFNIAVRTGLEAVFLLLLL